MDQITALPGHKVIQFARNVDLVGQQRKSRLVNHVDADMAYTEAGDRYTDELMGLSEPIDVLEDIGPTPGGTISKHRRIGMFKYYEDGKWVGTREKAEQLVNPTNKTVVAMGNGRERRRDKTIYKGMFAPAWETDSEGDPVSIPFPTSQVIAVDELTYYKGKADGDVAPTAPTVLTLPKIRMGLVKADASLIADGEWCVGYEMTDLQNMMTSIEAGSREFDHAQRLENGETDMWKGLRWVRLAPGTIKPDANGKFELPMWNSGQLLYKERPMVTTQVTMRADMRYNWHAYYQAGDSTLRRQDKGFIKILVER